MGELAGGIEWVMRQMSVAGFEVSKAIESDVEYWCSVHEDLAVVVCFLYRSSSQARDIKQYISSVNGRGPRIQ